jgi:hypothetical protein
MENLSQEWVLISARALGAQQAARAVADVA